MATATITGDFGRLQKLEQGLKRLPQEVLPKAGDAAGDASKKEYLEGFAAARSPMGAPWAPTLDGGPTLFESGALAQPSVSVSSTKVQLQAGEYYGIFHQGGWQVGGERVTVKEKGGARDRHGRFTGKKKTIRVGGRDAGPARPILPPPGELGLWEEPIRTAVDQRVGEVLEKLGG
jgi:hypothetical protein